MKLKHTLVVTVLCCVLPTTTRAVDLTAIDRSIKKEPSYQTEPRYCLLLFGKEARTRVWLVVDGKRLYVDRNGNGDLTEPNEFVAANNKGDFLVGDITEADAKTVHPSLKLSGFYHKVNLPNVRQGLRMSITLASGVRQWAGPSPVGIQFAARPLDALIIHFNGPMKLGHYGPIQDLRRDKGGTLAFVIGSPGLGKGTFAMTDFDAVFGDSERKVTAEFEFPSGKAGGDPVILLERSGFRPMGSYRGIYSKPTIPVGAGAGFAKVTLSLPDRKEEEIAPGTFKALIVGGLQDLPNVAAALKAGDWADRESIIGVLGSQQRSDPHEKVSELLISALDDPHPWVRRKAAKALGQGGRVSLKALPRLVPLLHESPASVRREAARAIASIDPDKIAPLIESMRDANESDVAIKELAAASLKSQGFLVVYSRKLNAWTMVKVPRYVNSPNISNDSLTHVDQLTNLTELDLDRTQIDDHGLSRIKDLKKLTKLQLYKTKITDPGLQHVVNLTQLRNLVLSGTQITNDGLKHIQDLTKLTYLNLGESSISDEGLAHLKKLKSLRSLHLYDSRVTSAGMAHLTDMQQLDTLDLRNTAVDDNAVVHISKLKKLCRLYVNGSQITDEGKAKLRLSLPKLRSLE